MRILVFIGTRPEAIKMAPVVKALAAEPSLKTAVCATGQHNELLYPILDVFGIVPDFKRDVMEPHQSLNKLFSKLVTATDELISEFEPDLVLVHGDTSTAAAGALAAFHRGVRVGHVEAGLRTGDMTQPWPEEMNRRLVDMLADLHFAPTAKARDALLREGVPAEKIDVTGNTVVDALLMTAEMINRDEALKADLEARHMPYLGCRNLVLVTGHRRENFGDGIKNICLALRRIAADEDTCVVYPVHLNPNVRSPVHELLSGADRVFLTEPFDYVNFVYLMQRSAVILTDSGGIQEEAPTFGVPVLVMRNVTERPEAIEAGTAVLVGTMPDRIVEAVTEALHRRSLGAAPYPQNPFGDGQAVARIVGRILEARPVQSPSAG